MTLLGMQPKGPMLTMPCMRGLCCASRATPQERTSSPLMLNGTRFSEAVRVSSMRGSSIPSQSSRNGAESAECAKVMRGRVLAGAPAWSGRVRPPPSLRENGAPVAGGVAVTAFVAGRCGRLFELGFVS